MYRKKIHKMQIKMYCGFEFRDPEMTMGCEVEVVRDNGYGKLRHSKKLGESPIRAVNSNDHQLIIKPDPEPVSYTHLTLPTIYSV